MKYHNYLKWQHLTYLLVLSACTPLLTNLAFSEEMPAKRPKDSTHLPTTASTNDAAKDVNGRATIGRVIRLFEKGSGIPLKRVEVKYEQVIAYSDQLGQLRVDIPSHGPGNLQLSRSGYENTSISFDDLRNGFEHEFYLYPVLKDDDAVVVEGTRRTTISRKTISIEESTSVAPGGDPAQIVKLLPGVQTSSFRPDVVVRGSGPSDSKYYIDDLEVPFIFHSIGNLSLTPAPLLSEVQFDSGGFGPEYGDATGGVIVLKTTTELPKRPKTYFTLNLPLYSGILHIRPLSADTALSISLRRSYVEYFVKKVMEKQAAGSETTGKGTTIVPYFGDAHIAYTVKESSGHMKATLITAQDGLLAVIPTDLAANAEGTSTLNTKSSFVNLGLERLHRIDRDWTYRSTPQLYWFNAKNNFFGNKVNLAISRFRMPSEFSRRLSKDEDLILGFDPSLAIAKYDLYSIRYQQDDPSFDPEDAPKIKISDTEYLHSMAAWLNVDHKLGDLKVSPGLRGNYSSNINKFQIDPRLRLLFDLDGQHQLKVAIGQYSKAPDPAEASKDYGTKDLDYETSIHYVGGLQTKWSDKWTSEFQLFYKNAYNIISADPIKKYNNDGSFYSQGAEIFLRRNMTSRLFGWLSYTYSQTKFRKNDSEPFRRSQYDQTHVLNLVANYNLSSTWSLGGRYNHHSGDTFSPIAKAVYNSNFDRYQARQNPDDENSDRLPNFNSLSAYSSYDFLFNTWQLTLKCGLESYWNRPQTIAATYNYDYSEKEYQTGIGAIPFLELKGEL